MNNNNLNNNNLNKNNLNNNNLNNKDSSNNNNLSTNNPGNNYLDNVGNNLSNNNGNNFENNNSATVPRVSQSVGNTVSEQVNSYTIRPAYSQQPSTAAAGENQAAPNISGSTNNFSAMGHSGSWDGSAQFYISNFSGEAVTHLISGLPDVPNPTKNYTSERANIFLNDHRPSAGQPSSNATGGYVNQHPYLNNFDPYNSDTSMQQPLQIIIVSTLASSLRLPIMFQITYQLRLPLMFRYLRLSLVLRRRRPI